MMDYRIWREPEPWGLTDDEFQSNMLLNSKIDKVYWKLWMDNALEAMTHKLPFVSELYYTEERPCLVCGAGPSLQRNADAIRTAYSRGWQIISTDRALKTLRDIGVKEDLSVTTECQPECGDFLVAAGAGDKAAVNLVSCPETRNALINRGAHVFHVGDMCPSSPFWQTLSSKENFGPDITCVRPNLIVTYAAVDIAFWMSKKPRMIVTIGNDLCYETLESCLEDTSEAHIFPDKSSLKAKRVYCLEDGRFTFDLFALAALRFSFFPYWHPEFKFYDASGGIMHWSKIKDMKKWLEGESYEKDIICDDDRVVADSGREDCRRTA